MSPAGPNIIPGEPLVQKSLAISVKVASKLAALTSGLSVSVQAAAEMLSSGRIVRASQRFRLVVVGDTGCAKLAVAAGWRYRARYIRKRPPAVPSS